NSVPAWIPIFQKFSSGVDTDIPGKEFGSSVDTVSLGNRLQRECRYSRDISSSVNTESQRQEFGSGEFSSNVNANIPFIQRGYRFLENQFQRGYRYSRDIGFGVDTESQRISVPAWIPNPKDKDISSSVDTKSQRISVLTWIPNPIGISVPTWIPNPGSQTSHIHIYNSHLSFSKFNQN
ncbi:hypothetical protein RhiirA4_483944, partial [Rhizophagus irregularis]